MSVQSIMKKFGLLAAAVLACVVVTGCSQKGEAVEKVEAPSEKELAIEKVEAVLKQMTNAPDNEYQKLLREAMDGGVHEFGSAEHLEAEAALENYIKDLYQSYFTEDGLSEFRATAMDSQFQMYDDVDYKLELLESGVKQSDVDTASNQFHITAVVELTVPNKEPTKHKFVGLAIINKKEGKIGRFSIGQKDPTLNHVFNELINSQ
ncbi:hypothetical protein [Sporosarcina sp. A2]|uniref:hypothetical protein n=1 Tax=Sporosarcina sp. A2 TaxID=3393449 RepID=UPI003D78C06E